MAKKKINSTQILSITILVIFVTSLAASFIIPFTNKNDTADQSDIAQQLQDLQSQQAEDASEPSEIDENLKQEGDINSMQIIDITTGTGQEVKLGDTIKVKYKGALASSGSVFDQNDEGVEFELSAGNLIEGWVEGVPGMKVGGKRKLVIPSEKGYGEAGAGSTIPPNSDLIFEIELVSIS